MGWVDIGKELSLHPEAPGIISSIRFCNEYGYHAMVPMDILHTVPQGIAKLIKETAMLYLSRTKSLDVVENRLRSFPVPRDTEVRCLPFRRFMTGLEGWGKWSGDDHIALLQQLPYVIGTNAEILGCSSEVLKAVLKSCFTAVRIYIMLHRDVVENKDLDEIMELCLEMGEQLQVAQKGLAAEEAANLDRPKVHAILHYRYFIRRFGSGLNFDTATFEMFHKRSVSLPYSRDNHKEKGMSDRLARWASNHSLVMTVADEELKDPTPKARGLYVRRRRRKRRIINVRVGEMLQGKHGCLRIYDERQRKAIKHAVLGCVTLLKLFGVNREELDAVENLEKVI